MGDYATKRTNQMPSATPTITPQQPKTYRDYRDNPPQSGPGVAQFQGPISQAVGWNPNRGDPNVRKAAKLVVEEPKKEVPKGPTPEQIQAQQLAAQKAQQQQAAAIAAQQAQFWAQHAASQRMKGL